MVTFKSGLVTKLLSHAPSSNLTCILPFASGKILLRDRDHFSPFWWKPVTEKDWLVSVDFFKTNDSPDFLTTDPTLFPPTNHSILYLCGVPASMTEVNVACRSLYNEKYAGFVVPSHFVWAAAGKVTQSVRIIHEKNVKIILVMDASENLIWCFYKPRSETLLLQYTFFIVTFNHH